MAIYYLDVDDEITSAAARLRDSSDDRIALVLTGGSRVATSRINFRLLAREAKHRNKRLAIVTADPSVQSVVRSAELPVFATVGDYERAETSRAQRIAAGGDSATSDVLDELATTVAPPARKAKRPGDAGRGRSVGVVPAFHVPRLAIVGLAAVLAVTVAAAGFFFYPSVTIVLTVRTLDVGPADVTATVDPTVTAVNVQTATLPGMDMAFPVSADGTFDATGQHVVDKQATGTVTFANMNNLLAVPVPAGTVVSTQSGVKFATASGVTVPKATIGAGNILTAGTVDANVTAVNGGVEGNVAAGTIVKVPTDLASFLVSVKNAAATTGGSHDVFTAVSQADVDAATSKIVDQLNAEFQTAMAAPDAVPSGAHVLTESAHLGVAVCDPDPAKLPETEESSFSLSCRATGTVTVAEASGLRTLADARMKSLLKSGYSLVDGSTSIDLGKATLDGRKVMVPLTVKALQAPNLDQTRLKAAIQGRSVTDARAYLSQYGDVDIASSPDWAGSMPAFDFRIEIRLVFPSPAASPSPSRSHSSPAAEPVSASVSPGE